MLIRRRLLTLHRRLISDAFQRALGTSSGSSADAQSRLLEHWREFDATKLSAEQMEALMVMAHRPGDSRSPEDVAKAFQSQFEKVTDDRKAMLVQKVAALSGLHAMAPLLAWSAASIKHNLLSNLEALLQGAAPAAPQEDVAGSSSSSSSSSAQLFLGDLLRLAHAAGNSAPGQDDKATLLSFLASPSSLSWEELLGMPHLEHMLVQVSASDAMLGSMLQLLGVLGEQAAVPPPLLLQLELRQIRAHAEKGMQQQSTGDPASSETSLIQNAIRLRLCTYIEDALGLGAHSTTDTAASAPAQMLLRLLRVHRPLGPGQQPQPVTSQQQQQEADAKGAGDAASTSSSSSSGGGLLSNSVNMGFVGAPVELGLTGLSDLVQQAAVRLEEGLGKAAAVDRVLGSSHAQVHAALTRLSESGHGSAASLMKQLQDVRTRLLLAGDVLTLASATAADLDALEPSEFWGLYEASKRADLVGSTLAHSLLQPSVLSNQDSSSSSSSSNRASGSKPINLDLLWSLPPSDRAALAWVLLRGGAPKNTHKQAPSSSSSSSNSSSSSRVQQAVRKLYQGFEARAVAAYQDRATAAQAATDLARAAQLEYDLSQVNYVDERPPPLLSLLGGGDPGTGFPDPNTLLPTPPLPPPEEIARARASLPSSQLLLFDLLGEELQGEGATSELQVQMAFDALRKEAQLPNASMVDELHLSPTYAAWAQETKQRLLGLTPPALALLARFLEVRLGRSREDVSEAATRLRLLLREVAVALERAERLQEAETASKRANRRKAPSTSGEVNPYWVSPDAPRTEKAKMAETAAQDPYLSMLPSPEDVRALLGGGGEGFGSAEGEAAEFEAWLRSEALLGAESGAKLRKQEGKTQPYELLAEQHLDMDIERFLTMEHDPQLHMCFEGAAPRPWRDPEGAALNEEAFLESMRPLLNRYLGVRGMRPLLDSEWQVYSEAALEEWSQKRGAHESALRAVGHSAFFNSRAESVYLRQLVASGIPAGAPLAEQAQRYMAVLETNPTWTFAQKKHAAKRLIELSSHFARQPPPSERGSPFAPLFAASSKPSDSQAAQHLVAPSLAEKEGQASTTPLPQGW